MLRSAARIAWRFAVKYLVVNSTCSLHYVGIMSHCLPEQIRYSVAIHEPIKESDMNYSKKNVLCAVLALLCFSTDPVRASEKVSDLLATLSNAKAQAEGRAHRIQICKILRGTGKLEVLLSKYDDARNPFNGRLDSWMFSIRTGKSTAAENALEPEKLGDSLTKIKEFVDFADRELAKSGCPTKVLWKEAAAGITLLPAIMGAISDLLKRTDRDEKERLELVKALEERKIVQWDGVQVFVVYDWGTVKFLPAAEITYSELRKAGTSVYVNMWTFSKDPGPWVVVSKGTPDGLGESYKLYIGKIEDLDRFAGTKIKLQQ